AHRGRGHCLPRAGDPPDRRGLGGCAPRQPWPGHPDRLRRRNRGGGHRLLPGLSRWAPFGGALREPVPRPPRAHRAIRALLRPPWRQGDTRLSLPDRLTYLGIDARRHGPHAVLALPALQRDRRARLGGSHRVRGLPVWRQSPPDHRSPAGDRDRWARADRARCDHAGRDTGARRAAMKIATPPPTSTAPRPPMTCAVPIVSESAAAASTGRAVTPLITM